MIAIFALLVVLAWMLVGEPLYGHWSAQQMLRQLHQGDRQARIRLYRAWMLDLWLTALAAWLVGKQLWGWSAEQQGFAWPHNSQNLPLQAVLETVLGLLIGVIVVWALRRLLRKKPPRPRPAVPSDVLLNHAGWQLLPRSGQERWWWVGVSLTAGIAEEIVWRGFALCALQAWWPQVPVWVAVVVLAAVFGLAHLYQGAAGVLITGLVGAVLIGLYLATGSLLWPILLHIALDLRALLTPREPLVSSDPSRVAN